LPKYEDLVAEVTELRVRLEYEKDNAELKARLAEKEALLRKVAAMREANPMLGFRGVRLGVLWPEINRMQVRAIMEAACELTKEGLRVYPEIMIPVTANANELKILKELVDETARKVMEEQGVTVKYKFGTMIEIPRAALTAGEFARYAEFFSFGTNDLTQTVYGISRDDAEGKFLLAYVEKGVIPANPFQTLDREGVGRIMKMCVEEARQVRPDIEIGICGEHGGDPASIEFCHIIGLNYVSCSPFRVPIARLAAAQAALQHEYGLTKKVIV
jgi:pyruvate,orthophosphate dikinase